tara:strand:+ start:327 stop:509 length:183 start_codon:yes stop_codon:yes gene_type:complete
MGRRRRKNKERRAAKKRDKALKTLIEKQQLDMAKDEKMFKQKLRIPKSKWEWGSREWVDK